jgi:hypothetical protein
VSGFAKRAWTLSPNKGERFFDRGDWHSQLMSVVELYRERHSLDQRYGSADDGSADEMREGIRRDLCHSIEAIEKCSELGSARFLALVPR